MMQAIPIRRMETERPPEVDVVEMIWHCETKRLSAADRRAYEFLHGETGGGRQSVLTTTKAIGRDQGTSNDAGADRLKNLKVVGLIDYKLAQKRGSYEVWLLDPFQALRAIGVTDPQMYLFENTAGEPLSQSLAIARPDDVPCSPAGNTASQGPSTPLAGHPGEDPPEEPREVPPPAPLSRLSEPSVLKSLQRPSTISEPSEPSEDGGLPVALAGEEVRRGTSGGTSPEIDLVAELKRRRQQVGVPQQIDALDVTRVAAIAASMGRIPTERELQGRREHWVHVIKTRVKDDALYESVMIKVASAVVSGGLDPSDVMSILANLDKHRREKTLERAPGIYFVKSVKRLFQRRGLQWDQKPKPR